MKLLLSCVFLLALSGAAFGENVVLGLRPSSDLLLLREPIIRRAQTETFHVVKVNFPNEGDENSNDHIITSILVHDHGSGVSASLGSGGTGYRYAIIYLSNLIGRGINCTVEIWGRP